MTREITRSDLERVVDDVMEAFGRDASAYGESVFESAVDATAAVLRRAGVCQTSESSKAPEPRLAVPPMPLPAPPPILAFLGLDPEGDPAEERRALLQSIRGFYPEFNYADECRASPQDLAQTLRDWLIRSIGEAFTYFGLGGVHRLAMMAGHARKLNQLTIELSREA